MTVVISVENLSKSYHLGQISTGTFTYDLQSWWAKVRGKPHPWQIIGRDDMGHRDGEIVWALRDVSLKVEQGEVLGIIGRNGAGKSTLLKILSRVTAPASGKVKVKGRIASLLEVGTGFHPDLTGRENVYLNGAIMGMSKQEVARKFDEIVDFSGVEKFIDTPVKRYSSGMYVRLAFAVAAHLEPEILVVDEVLAVGDAEFQKKCLGKMGIVAKEGRTVLFVSHNMAAVENLCRRGIVLVNGQVTIDRTIQEAIHYYTNELISPAVKNSLLARTDRKGNGQIQLAGFWMEDASGKPLDAIRSGMDINFVFEYVCPQATPLQNVDIGFSFHTMTGNPLFILYSSNSGVTFDITHSRGVIRCKILRFPLPAGQYLLGARMTVKGEEADWPQDGVSEIQVDEGDFYGTGRTHIGYTKQTPAFLINGEWSSQ
jgi:lipopolysaccharide transport system ATP-binding protein